MPNTSPVTMIPVMRLARPKRLANSLQPMLEAMPPSEMIEARVGGSSWPPRPGAKVQERPNPGAGAVKLPAMRDIARDVAERRLVVEHQREAGEEAGPV